MSSSTHNRAINLNMQNYVLPHPVVAAAATAANTCYIAWLCALPLKPSLSLRFHDKQKGQAERQKLPYSFALLKHEIFKNLYSTPRAAALPCEEIIYDNVYLRRQQRERDSRFGEVL
jgi:hypothetical protein